MKSLAIVLIAIGLCGSVLGGYWIYSDYLAQFASPKPDASYTSDNASLPSVEFDGTHPVKLSYGRLSVTVDPLTISDGRRVASVAGFVEGNEVFSMRFDSEDSSTAANQAPNASVRLLWLNRTAIIPQVVMTQFSGGAHCCTLTKIATNDNGHWKVVDGDRLDGDFGYTFQDLDNDGGNELISVDNSFLYAFECYACSYAPTRIKKLVGAELKDVTTGQQYSDFLREQLRKMESDARANPALLHSNGYLGGWVAAKALVGEFEDAWRTMLVNYNRASDWVMEECAVPVPLNQCPPASRQRLDFPDALLKHLVDHGYVSSDEQSRLAPKPTVAPEPPAPPVSAPVPEPRVYYVANTSPPDPFLALRTLPSTSAGQRIMAMPNGTVLHVLERSNDGWWRVRTNSGAEGWALSGDRSGKQWIVCCVDPSKAGVDQINSTPARVIGAARVVSTSTIAINGQMIALQGVGGLAGVYADQFQAFLREQGGQVSCDRTPDGTYRCRTKSNIDLSAAVIFNGSGRLLGNAPDDLRRAEQSARERKAGLWSSVQ